MQSWVEVIITIKFVREVSECRKNSRKKAGRRKKGREGVKISMTCCKTNKILFVQSTNVFYKGCMYYILYDIVLSNSLALHSTEIPYFVQKAIAS